MASWNYRMSSCDDQAENVMVSYDMTRLQRLPTEDPLHRLARRS